MLFLDRRIAPGAGLSCCRTHFRRCTKGFMAISDPNDIVHTYRKMDFANELNARDTLDGSALEGIIMLLRSFDPNHPLLASI
jgi:hypothetical protein